jgi:hypothetical protein
MSLEAVRDSHSKLVDLAISGIKLWDLGSDGEAESVPDRKI